MLVHLRAYPNSILMVSWRENFSATGGCTMGTEQETVRRDWRIPDELWECIQPLLPPRKPHPLGGHRPRVDDRKAMDAIFFVLRTGCQWGALDATGLCSHSAAHRREWLAMDGAMTKAPLGGKKVGKTPTDRGKS